MQGDLSVVRSVAGELSCEYEGMLSIIEEGLPAVHAATAQFGKSHSQFQYALLDIAGPVAGVTKLRNWRQTAAVMQQTRDALEEASIKLRLAEVDAEEAEYMSQDANHFEQQRWEARAAEARSMAARIRRNMAGAVRKLAAYTLQFQELERQLRVDLGKGPDDPITEEDFERDEARFHVMTAFRQALQAARVNGRIDHGNFIYLDDIGIPGLLAQADILEYMDAERAFAQQNRSAPDAVHEFQRQWLERMGAKYAACPGRLAESKGLIPGVLPQATLRIHGGE